MQISIKLNLVGLGIVGCFLGLLVVSGCSRGGRDASREEIRIAISSEPTQLDPSLLEDGASLKVAHNLWWGLYGYDAAGERVRRLAESETWSPDRLRLTVKLRDAKWSDGVPVQADDFVIGIRRSLAPETPSKLAEFLFPISGAREFRTGKAAMLAGVRAVDLRTVEFLLSKKTAWFLDALTLPVAFPQRADVLKKFGGKWPLEAPATGPYQLKSRTRDQGWSLEPRLEIAPDARPIRLVVVADETTALSLFDSGRLDVIGRVPPLDYARLKRSGRAQTTEFLATYFYAFNTRKGPARNANFRHRVALGIRKSEIPTLLMTGEQPAEHLVPPGLRAGVLPVRPDAPALPARGDELGKLPIEIGFDSNSRNQLIAEKIQSDLKAAGILVTLANLDWKSYLKQLSTDPKPIYRFAWLAPFRDPITHLSAFRSDSPNNYTGWKNAEYDRLVDEISGLDPGPAREARIRDAERILIQREGVVIPLYFYVQTHAIAERIEGFRVNPMGVIPWDSLRIKAGTN